MNARIDDSPMSLMRRYWRDRHRRTTAADVCAVLVALTLPWSTSGVAIFVACWLVATVWTMDWSAYLQLLKQPVCYLPLSLIGLALIGTLWSDAAWSARLFAINPTIKLLVLPVLFYHFGRSKRGMWVFVAFLVSCTLLMLMSWIVAIDPSLSLKAPGEQGGGPGIFVKNHIAQSQEFALCALALAYPIFSLLRSNRPWPALVLGAIVLGFAVNMAFLSVSRTAMVTIPIMLAVFALLHLKWRTSLMIFSALIIMAGLAWATSPQLQQKTEAFFTDYQLYKTRNAATSIGLRLEFWKKSLDFFAEAPIVGHGTGSTRGLFERAASGNTNSATREVISNPHNQTLNVAVQWGIIGVVLLYAMWLVHLLLFRGDGLVAWIGLLVVVQNIFTSLFNSHIFDFHEGWMYVLGVGVAGGMTLAAKRHNSQVRPVGS